MIAISSCGVDRLLDNSYQHDYKVTIHPVEREELLKAKKKRE